MPGIDCAFVGPQDLSGSLGCTPMLESPDPRFQEALEKIQAAARRHDVATGIMVATAEQANRRAEQGFQMIALAAEVRLFSAAISQLIAQLKRP